MSNIIKFLKHKKIMVKPCVPFGNLEINFLDNLSKKLMANNRARNFPDVISFAFWCRKKNIISLKNKLNTAEVRIGLGCIFHITPSNVPLNLAYSFFLGLLTGNSNIVKLPTTSFKQTRILNGMIKKVLSKTRFYTLKLRNIFLNYKSENNKLTQDRLI